MATIKDWIEALRPKTLPAGIVPVALGSAYSYNQGKFDWLTCLVILFCSVMIQIITNFFNEIYDFKKGADTEERQGPARGVSTGAIKLSTIWIVTIISLIITFIAGLYLVQKAGVVILIIGIISLIMSWFYTGGPYPLAYKGLGDLFVLIFFGFVATAGTYFVFHQEINLEILIISIIPGFTSMNILAANNIRDISTDVKVNKLTMAVRMGESLSKKVFVVVALSTYLAIIYLFILTANTNLIYNVFTLPLYFLINKKLFEGVGRELNKVLALTGLQLMLFGIINTIAFIY